MYLTISLDDLGIAYREFMMDCHRIVAIVLLRLNMRRMHTRCSLTAGFDSRRAS